jgi:RNA polymerase sporulation-specific sigma factor
MKKVAGRLKLIYSHNTQNHTGHHKNHEVNNHNKNLSLADVGVLKLRVIRNTPHKVINGCGNKTENCNCTYAHRSTELFDFFHINLSFTKGLAKSTGEINILNRGDFLDLLNLLSNLMFLILHVTDTDSFPKPLSKKEEEQYLKEMSEGSEIARKKLIQHNLRLVAHIIKKYYSNYSEQDDLISIGTIGLIKGINSFKPEKGTKLATYCARCIENEILMYLRKTASRKNEMSIDEPLNVDWDGNELLLSDVLGSDSDSVNRNIEYQDEKRRLLCLVKQLSDRERNIMTMRFGLFGSKEYTQKQVADMLGISQSYISRLEKRILEKLKKELMKME